MQHAGFAKKLPRFIAVEGPIGVGKTSLSKRLAASFNYELLLENSDENPFLERFYQNPKAHALSTQLYFLFQRAQQIQELRQDDMFQPVRVADFLIDKDMLFAQQNLDSEEYELYLKVFRHLTIDAPVPDLVIYLQAPTSVLLDRIRRLAEQGYVYSQYRLGVVQGLGFRKLCLSCFSRLHLLVLQLLKTMHKP